MEAVEKEPKDVCIYYIIESNVSKSFRSWVKEKHSTGRKL